MNYDALISSITEAHQHAQAGAAGAVNRHLILRNWLIGAWLVEFEQNGEDRAKYGAGMLKRVATDLAVRSVSGCAVRMLERMRSFYREYPQLAGLISSPVVTNFENESSQAEKSSPQVGFFKILPPQIQQPPVAESTDEPKCSPVVTKSPPALPAAALLHLSWTHFIELLALDDPWKRAFYENECLKANWSKRLIEADCAAWEQNHQPEAKTD